MADHRGPVKDRSCTDVLCLLVFIAFLAGWGIVGYFGKNWHPRRLEAYDVTNFLFLLKDSF